MWPELHERACDTLDDLPNKDAVNSMSEFVDVLFPNTQILHPPPNASSDASSCDDASDDEEERFHLHLVSAVPHIRVETVVIGPAEKENITRLNWGSGAEIGSRLVLFVRCWPRGRIGQPLAHGETRYLSVLRADSPNADSRYIRDAQTYGVPMQLEVATIRLSCLTSAHRPRREAVPLLPVHFFGIRGHEECMKMGLVVGRCNNAAVLGCVDEETGEPGRHLAVLRDVLNGVRPKADYASAMLGAAHVLDECGRTGYECHQPKPSSCDLARASSEALDAVSILETLDSGVGVADAVGMPWGLPAWMLAASRVAAYPERFGIRVASTSNVCAARRLASLFESQTRHIALTTQRSSFMWGIDLVLDATRMRLAVRGLRNQPAARSASGGAEKHEAHWTRPMERTPVGHSSAGHDRRVQHAWRHLARIGGELARELVSRGSRALTVWLKASVSTERWLQDVHYCGEPILSMPHTPGFASKCDAPGVPVAERAREALGQHFELSILRGIPFSFLTHLPLVATVDAFTVRNGHGASGQDASCTKCGNAVRATHSLVLSGIRPESGGVQCASCVEERAGTVVHRDAECASPAPTPSSRSCLTS